MAEPTPEDTARAQMAIDAIRNLVGDQELSTQLLEDLALTLLALPEGLPTANLEVFSSYCEAVASLRTNPPPPEGKADRVLVALERRPKLLNAVVLRCLERGYVADNLAYMYVELDVKIALPWVHDASGLVPFWYRPRYPVHVLKNDNCEVVAEVTTVEGDIEATSYDWSTYADTSENVDHPEKAMKAADARLRKRGWVLL